MAEQSELAASELEVARSIYGPDWTDIPPKKTAWGTAQEAGWWQVKLRTEDGRVSVGLRGRITKQYPKQPPPLQLVDPVMLSPDHVQSLLRHLQDLSKTLVGGDMIFDLAEATREWITNNHMPLPKPGAEVPTLMEEMARREQAQRAAEAARKELDLQNQMAQAAEQNRLLDERIQLDASRKEERARQAVLEEAERARLESITSLSDGELDSRELHLETPVSIDGHESFSSWILFGGRRENLWTSYIAEPLGTDGTVNPDFVKASLPSMTVQVIDFSKAYYSTAQGKKKIDSLATEIGRMKEIKHENVLQVYGVKRDKSPKGWERLIILVERVSDGGKLKGWLGRDGVGEETARDYLGQILSGLAEVHKHNITQKQLDADSVVIAFSPSRLAKLSNTGYARRIIEYHRSNPFLKGYEDPIPDSWLSPDEIDSPYSHSKARDIWHAGLLMLQMLFGQNCLLAYPSLNTLLQHAPGGISESMLEILTGLLHPLHKKRMTAEEGLRKLRAEDEVTTVGSKHVRIPFGGRSAPSPGFPSPQDPFGRSPTTARGFASYFPSSAPASGPLQSRYRTDFEEVEFLGKGGFGEVVKARNKLDGRSYAIKKVKLRPEDNEQKVYREVNSLSRVSHQYIVRYYGCWLEDTGRIEPPLSTGSGSGTLPSQNPEDEDIFATNFDDLSVSRRDHSRSASSFPRIRFANSGESDEESEDSVESDDGDDSSEGGQTAADPSEARAQPVPKETRGRSMVIANKASLSLTDGTTDDGGVQRILYIQMEFVEKQTLREAITSGLTEDEAWRLLLQILEALAHMSSLGIVHRDLKPSNILLDANGNVKIADFGLSTTDMTTIDPGVNLGNSADLSDQTSGIGTSLYIAPEVAISRSYNEKADMYSLGVIFFEMCYPFRTSMERAQILTALRQPSITFPLGWSSEQKSNQKETITWLLRHDPNMRPRATELLASALLPSPEKQKEYYENAIAALTNPKSTQYPALIDALFTCSPAHTFSTSTDNRLEDYTYDNNSEHDHELQIWLTIVLQRLVDLLQRHGAVDDYLPLLIPETTLLSAFPDLSPVRLLDQSGKVVQLPSSDLLGLARSATRRQIERIKRYHVGRRYVDHPAGGQPRVTGEMSFDIVSPIRSSAAEAELLEIVDKVITEFHGDRGSFPSDYDFHVSHESVLATILSVVPDRARSSVLKVFKSIGSSTSTSQIKAFLGGVTGLTKQLRDDLEECCAASDFEPVRAKLESIFSTSRRRLSAALDEVEGVIKLARACGVKRKILFRPVLSRNAEFFRGGFMFECVRRGKQRDVVAFGGRYDSLLEHFKEPAQQMQSRRVYGAGMSIAVDQLARMVRKYESSLSARLMTKENEDERSFGMWSPARCDVYVAAVAQVDLAARLSVIGELWRAGIRADLQYDDERSLDEVQVECLEQNTLFLVIPRANRPIVKVRSVLKRSEEEVPRNELCNWLRMAILEQRRVDASYASFEGSAPSSLSIQSGTMASSESRQGELADIRLVLPPDPVANKPTKTKPVRKHRHVTKSVYYDKANDFALSIKTPLPIYGIDLPSPFLSSLCLDPTWINDDEAWRSVLQSGNIPGSERKYCEQVRESLSDFKNRSGSGPAVGGGGGMGSTSGNCCWLFSVREGRGFLLQLGK